MDSAADIERIRQALSPNDGLVAYGGSYGSPYATAYLERYGEHVKALVLDGVVDHSVDLPTFMARNALSVREAFDRFAKWCEQDSTCALHGRDLGASVFDAAVATAPAARTVVPQRLAAGRDPQLGLAGPRPDARPGERRRHTSALDAMAGAAAPEEHRGGAIPGFLPGRRADLCTGVLCADFGPQRDYRRALPLRREAIARQAPRFAWRFWDATSTGAVRPAWETALGGPTKSGTPHTTLLAGGGAPQCAGGEPAYDSQTPLINALAVWLQIPEARLLIADVDGHQSLVWSRCAFEAMARFLADPDIGLVDHLVPRLTDDATAERQFFSFPNIPDPPTGKSNRSP